MIITYALSGSKDLCTLLAYLTKLIDPEDEIVCYNSLVGLEPGTFHLMKKYPMVKCIWNTHVNYEMCNGQYMFCIHSTEIPDERLLKNIKGILSYYKPEVVAIPRINIMHGYTSEELKEFKYTVNDTNGWVNWPDYHDRIFLKHCKPDFPNRILLAPEMKNTLTCVIHARSPH